MNQPHIHKYKNLSEEQRELILSEFLINSWSYSKVSEFSRNEKAFEMIYIYGYDYKSSATTIAGNAYHYALEKYFTEIKEGNILDIVDAESYAWDYLTDVNANSWKLQKTTPTIEACLNKASNSALKLIKNFYSESDIYLNDIAEVLYVEQYVTEYITVNGIDLPIPCNAKIDLIVKTKSGKIAIIDHKSKSQFSDQEEIKLMIGKQAITYVLCAESFFDIKVDEVWFIENKLSENRDKSPQLQKFTISIDNDTRKLYEALLYEPLRKMIQAVNDPDYVYMINDSDSFRDKAEVYDFWAKTMISEIEEFNIDPTKKELISVRLKKIKDASITSINPNIIKEFKKNAEQFIQYDLTNKNMTNEEKIEHVLRSFGCIVKVYKKLDGFSCDTYLLEISSGVKVSQIYPHRLDIANALNVPNIRISKDLVVYEDKTYLAVEVSKKREKDLIFDKKNVVGYKIPLGKNNMGEDVYWTLENHSTPHALVCGSTGSGKTASLHCMIEAVKSMGISRIIVLDPKFEFCSMNIEGVVVVSEILQIEEAMETLVKEMNDMVKNGKKEYTFIIFDEFADAQAQSRKGKELDIMEMVQVGFYAPKKGLGGFPLPPEPKMKLQKTGQKKSLEENLRILLQKGRSVGFRICAATQRASAKIINGDAKANFPIQICFRVPKEIDSRVVIDEPGAESLSGMGDGLIKSPEYKDTVRFQSYYIPTN